MFSASGRILGSVLSFFQGSPWPNVPGPNLPDLDAARAMQSGEPEAPPAIPSSQPNPDICGECDPVNHRPIAVAGGPYFGSPGQSIQFNGSSSWDPDGDDLIDYVWTFGDSSPAVEVHGANAYTDFYNFQVTHRSLTLAMTGVRGTAYHTYFLLIPPATIIHEALHSMTGLNDYDLGKRLGLSDDELNKEGSGAINRTLEDHGCSEKPAKTK
jgi:hypothetical protein